MKDVTSIDTDTSETGGERIARPDEVCVVCGRRVDLEDTESTSGWRWFSDGRGGLYPLCESCPVPEEFLSQPEQRRRPSSRR
jgi:hypothetical protein